MFSGLRFRLFSIAVLAVLVAEILIFIPSVARYRVVQLQQRIDAAYTAGLAIIDMPDAMLSGNTKEMMLNTARVRSIAIHAQGARILVQPEAGTEMISASYDLQSESVLAKIINALAYLLPGNSEGICHAAGPASSAPDSKIEITVDRRQLSRELLSYGKRIFWLSLIISLFTAAIIYLALNSLIVTPVTRLVESIIDFRNDPEQAEVFAAPEGNSEISIAGQELANMQTELKGALRQKARLAALGEAVAKIAHDLRNILTSAQLLSDRISMSGDPKTERIRGQLSLSIDRATDLCQQTLRYGKAEEATPQKHPVALKSLIDQVMMTSSAEAEASLTAPDNLEVLADPDQLFRILFNLVRNAQQAAEQAGQKADISFNASMNEAGETIIEVHDKGPGIPPEAQADLFTPFKGSSKDGTGLGLSIARELAELQGGAIVLAKTGTEGTSFRLTLPAAE